MEHIGTRPIDTPRTLLRRITPADAEDMFGNWANDPEVTRYLTWRPHGSIEVTRQVIALWQQENGSPDRYHWCIEWKENRAVIGTIGVVLLDAAHSAAEVGYCLSRRYWGRGIMTEALTAVEDYLFGQAGFDRLEAHHDILNPASGRVMFKSGMRLEEVRPAGRIGPDGRRSDLVCYALRREQWERARRNRH